jgi:hypothetical protein
MFMQVLSEILDRIISSGIWPTHSSYIKPFDFFFWGLFEEQSLQQ